MLAAASTLALGASSWMILVRDAPVRLSSWATVFRDDFEGPAGTGLAPEDWLYALGTGYSGGAPQWGTGEVETMTDSVANVAHDGTGNLTITPLRDPQGNWTSGRIETRRTDFVPPPGGLLRVEASLRQPDVTGEQAAGYWSAFWLLGDAARPVGATNWPSIGEIDIAEDINGRGSQFATLHCGAFPGGPCNEPVGIGSGELPCPGCQNALHQYAVEIDRSVSPEQLRWYRDDQLVFTIDQTRVDTDTWTRALHHGFFIIFDVAIGGSFPAAFGGGPTPQTRPGAPLVIDHVAVSRREAPPPPSTPPPGTPTNPGPRDAYARIEGESADEQHGTRTEACADLDDGLDVTALNNGDWLRFDNVDFDPGPATQLYARLASGAPPGVSGLLQIRLDDRNAAPAASLAIADTGGWQSWRTVPANLSGVTGRHTVYVTLTSGQPADYVNLNWISFGR
ncbi:glycoside hydrolase family 16 protein [Actinoplanes sp. NPDC049316]|uniref:glycoside hydrolase family 16 protein n=1 Tax=Actinoplanes sp. NPDC049316 TaxID=3154727 RepID=UPI00342B5405